MKVLSIYLFFLLYLFSSEVSASAAKKPQPKPSTHRLIQAEIPLYLDKTVDNRLEKLITTDLHALAALRIDVQDSQLRSLFELDPLSATSLLGWLSERVRYLVGQAFSLEKNVLLISDDTNGFYEYENPGVFPDEIEESIGGTQAIAERLMLMDGLKEQAAINLGSAVYLSGKYKQVLFGLNVAGKKIAITSPRTGVVKLDSAFNFMGNFMGNFVGDSLDDSSGAMEASVLNSTVSRRAYRLRSLFHEARHSDGHGKSLTFPHAKCPVGHDFEGRPLCDRSRNGSFRIGAEIVKMFLNDCENCDIKQKEILRALYLHDINRVLMEFPVKDNNSEVEMMIQALRSQAGVYQTLIAHELDPVKWRTYKEKLESIETEIKKLEQGLVLRNEATTDWPAAPEGIQ